MAHAVPGAGAARPARYRSLLSLAVPLRSALGIAALAAGAVAAIHAFRLAITFAVSPWPTERPDDLWDSAGAAATAVAAASVAVVALTGALFIAWGLRAYRNLPGLGIGDRRYWTVWLVAGWFIPGANLVVPRLLMGDVWRASSPSLPAHPGPGWRRRPVGDVVNRWWVLWLTAPAVAVVVAGLVAQAPSDLAEIKLWEAAGVIAGLALAGSAAAARQMVGIVTVAQARRAEIVAWADEPLWTWTQSRRDQKLATL